MLNPARPFIVWFATQVVGLFVIMNVIPEHVADLYVEALAQGITYLMTAAMSFYYMKKLYDNQGKLQLPREKIEELIKKGVSHIPCSDSKTSPEPTFHTESNDFFTTNELPENNVMTTFPEEQINVTTSTNEPSETITLETKSEQ